MQMQLNKAKGRGCGETKEKLLAARAFENERQSDVGKRMEREVL